MTKRAEELAEFPPRVSVERRHKDILTGELKWSGLNPRCNKIIDHVVADEYLSLEEHSALMQAKDKEIERLKEALEILIEHGDKALIGAGIK